MIFAVLGGDDRFVRLLRLLRDSGHTALPFALERAVPDCAADPADAIGPADALILPIPAEKGGALNAPFASAAPSAAALVRLAAPGTPVFCGAPGESLRAACLDGALPLHDLLQSEPFALRNAALTAEGAVALLAEGPDAVLGKRVLVAGCGRIGRALVSRLCALEAEVTLAARRPEDRDWAARLGCRAVTLDDAPAPGYDAVLNTVPAPVFGRAALERFGNARLIELASAPYGFDAAAAAALGNPVRLAAGLPGAYAPEAAARAIRDAVCAVSADPKFLKSGGTDPQ